MHCIQNTQNTYILLKFHNYLNLFDFSVKDIYFYFRYKFLWIQDQIYQTNSSFYLFVDYRIVLILHICSFTMLLLQQ